MKGSGGQADGTQSSEYGPAASLIPDTLVSGFIHPSAVLGYWAETGTQEEASLPCVPSHEGHVLPDEMSSKLPEEFPSVQGMLGRSTSFS